MTRLRDEPAPRPGGPETAQTLSRGLDVLELLASAGHGLSPAQIAGELGLNRTVVHRLVATLEAHGFARRRVDGTFLVGSRVLGLGVHAYAAVREGAGPVLRRLADELGATAHLSVVDGDETVAVAVVEPTRADFHLSYRVGTRAPLSRGAHCRALLAARRGRYEVVSGKGELIPGAHGVAVAVPGLRDLEGAIGVIALAPFAAADVGARLRLAADELAAAL